MVACWSSGPRLLKCLVHDGQGPSGFHGKLLIPSHQHEMLIVRRSGSRRLRFVSSSPALISAGTAGFGFPHQAPVVPVLSSPLKAHPWDAVVFYIGGARLRCSSIFACGRKRNDSGNTFKNHHQNHHPPLPFPGKSRL